MGYYHLAMEYAAPLFRVRELFSYVLGNGEEKTPLWAMLVNVYTVNHMKKVTTVEAKLMLKPYLIVSSKQTSFCVCANSAVSEEGAGAGTGA
jgi:hypothetical protein